jgi:hypothetical protein
VFPFAIIRCSILEGNIVNYMNDVDEAEKWVLVSAEVDDKPSLVRFRSDLNIWRWRIRLPMLFKITWPYGDDHESGMPETADLDRMAEFENEAIPKLQLAGIGVLAVTTTYQGTRKWYVYAQGVEEFMTILDSVPEEGAPYPITLQKKLDPEWEYLRDIQAEFT